ncbi:GNAT family N-acetyltransferase [Rhodoferax sp.]|uniref:GNAT family N-acetyltransferase n=1 Tax=Rhodoferax sp. TaxID=50421 RepID=UPI002621B6BB|nr:GNAT family N-acetyltransferase [Rhodoferax sp.]MDD2925611.1 GNAT family N-acetyltransferase [Rhodoferax sp.]
MSITFHDYAHVPFPVWREMWLDYVGATASSLSEEVHQHTYARIRQAQGALHGLVACTDRPVGFAHYYFHPSSYCLADACTLEDLYVSPQARGQGIGRALIEAVAAHARAANAPALHWKTRSTNTTAQALYNRLAVRTEFLSYRKAL